MNNERQERILDLLNDRGEIHLSDLKNIFPQVSLMTLRRDLSTLENRGFLIRTRRRLLAQGRGKYGSKNEYSGKSDEIP